VYCSDAALHCQPILVETPVLPVPLEALTAHAVAAFTSQTNFAKVDPRIDHCLQGVSCPGKPSDSSSLQLLGRAVDLSPSELSTWSIPSDKPPGPCAESSDVPSMGATLIDRGYKFDADGFNEVGTLEEGFDCDDISATLNKDLAHAFE